MGLSVEKVRVWFGLSGEVVVAVAVAISEFRTVMGLSSVCEVELGSALKQQNIHKYVYILFFQSLSLSLSLSVYLSLIISI